MMLLLEQKTGLFDALVHEALYLCPMRSVCLQKDEDARAVMLTFLAQYRDLILKEVSEAGREQLLEIEREHINELCAIGDFVRYDHINMLLKIKANFSYLKLRGFGSAVRSLLSAREYLQVSYILEWGGRMLEHATCREDCWKFVANMTAGRVFDLLWGITKPQGLRAFISRVNVEVRDCEVRQKTVEKAMYAYNSLPHWGKPIEL